MSSINEERKNEILKAIRSGIATNEDRAELYEIMRKLCRKIAYDYQSRLRCRDEIEDLMQEAYLAVQQAAETFDPEKEKSFGSWLVFYLHRTYSAYIAAQNGCGIGEMQLRSMISRYEAEHYSVMGEKPKDCAICYRFNITPDKLASIRSGNMGALSLDQEDEDGYSLHELIDQGAAEEGKLLEDEVIYRFSMEEASKKLREYIDELNHEERQAIILFYYRNHTEAECADIMEIPKGKLSAIRQRALKKLRSAKHRAELGRLLPEWLGSKPYHSRSRWLSSTERSAFLLFERDHQRNPPNR